MVLLMLLRASNSFLGCSPVLPSQAAPWGPERGPQPRSCPLEAQPCPSCCQPPVKAPRQEGLTQASPPPMTLLCPGTEHSPGGARAQMRASRYLEPLGRAPERAGDTAGLFCSPPAS